MRRYLIDTHALLWAADDMARLGPAAARVLADQEAIVHVSIGTFWELTIKQTVGKLQLPERFFETVLDSGYSRLPIELAHLERYRALPLHHRDPFDRLLIAQAQAENLIIVGNDGAFGAYDVALVW